MKLEWTEEKPVLCLTGEYAKGDTIEVSDEEGEKLLRSSRGWKKIAKSAKPRAEKEKVSDD